MNVFDKGGSLNPLHRLISPQQQGVQPRAPDTIRELDASLQARIDTLGTPRNPVNEEECQRVRQRTNAILQRPNSPTSSPPRALNPGQRISPQRGRTLEQGGPKAKATPIEQARTSPQAKQALGNVLSKLTNWFRKGASQLKSDINPSDNRAFDEALWAEVEAGKTEVKTQPQLEDFDLDALAAQAKAMHPAPAASTDLSALFKSRGFDLPRGLVNNLTKQEQATCIAGLHKLSDLQKENLSDFLDAMKGVIEEAAENRPDQLKEVLQTTKTQVLEIMQKALSRGLPPPPPSQ